VYVLYLTLIIFVFLMTSEIPNKNQLHFELNVKDISTSFITHMLQHGVPPGDGRGQDLPPSH
jgi:hypothetical protein